MWKLTNGDRVFTDPAEVAQVWRDAPVGTSIRVQRGKHWSMGTFNEIKPVYLELAKLGGQHVRLPQK